MLWPFSLIGRQRRAERDAYLEALRAVVAIATEQAKATTAQAESFTAYLQSFKWDGPVQGWTYTDVDAMKREREALAESGYPVDANETQQLEWVMRSMPED